MCGKVQGVSIEGNIHVVKIDVDGHYTVKHLVAAVVLEE